MHDHAARTSGEGLDRDAFAERTKASMARQYLKDTGEAMTCPVCGHEMEAEDPDCTEWSCPESGELVWTREDAQDRPVAPGDRNPSGREAVLVCRLQALVEGLAGHLSEGGFGDMSSDLGTALARCAELSETLSPVKEDRDARLAAERASQERLSHRLAAVSYAKRAQEAAASLSITDMEGHGEAMRLLSAIAREISGLDVKISMNMLDFGEGCDGRRGRLKELKELREQRPRDVRHSPRGPRPIQPINIIFNR